MICTLIRFIAFAQLLAFCSAKCEAAVIWEYDLTNLGTPRTLGNPFVLAKTNLNDGAVFFTASLVVTGTAVSGSSDVGYQPFAVDSGGLGVVGTQANGNTLNGAAGAESLRFSVVLSQITGGSVVFNGFTTVGFRGFSGSDRGFLSKDAVFSSGDDTLLEPLGGTLSLAAVTDNATAFSIFSNAGSFQVAKVTGAFTGIAAVPEPSTFAAFAGIVTAIPLMRRFRRPPNSVDSESLVA